MTKGLYANIKLVPFDLQLTRGFTLTNFIIPGGAKIPFCFELIWYNFFYLSDN